LVFWGVKSESHGEVTNILEKQIASIFRVAVSQWSYRRRVINRNGDKSQKSKRKGQAMGVVRWGKKK
jgi:uncharacterized protein YegJ (DUF2314 family)